MTVMDAESRDERRRAAREAAQRLTASGALDELFERIDAGEVELEGRDGLIQQLIKTGLERGLNAELSDHLGYELGDPAAAVFPNSRNGSYPKTVASQSATLSSTSRAIATGPSARHWCRRDRGAWAGSMT